MGKKRKREETFEDPVDLAEALFVKGARKVREEYADAVAVFVPTIVVYHRGATLSVSAAEMMLNGLYVELAAASRAEITKVLSLDVREDRRRSKAVDEVMERLDLEFPA